MNAALQQQLIDELITHFQKGDQFSSVVELREFASRIYGKPIRPGMGETKIVEECAEKGLVQVAGSLLDQSATVPEAFDRLVDLYQRQPNLSTRTSDSVARQAYSTPLPIAFLASALAGIRPGQTVYEPTAGNGALLLNADRALVYANEIYDDRIAQLKAQGFGTITQADGTTHQPPERVDVVVLNPPFGTLREGDKNKRWTIAGGPATPKYPTTQIDQVIAFKALEAMQDDGRAVLILPAPMEQKTGNQEGASNAYNSRQNVPFWLSLYRNYNVTQHFTVAGHLYAGQGTSFPVDVVVIAGRGRSARKLPAADLPVVYQSFQQLKELLPNEPLLRNRESRNSANGRNHNSATTGGIGAEPPATGQQSVGMDGSVTRSRGLDDPPMDDGRGADDSGSVSPDQSNDRSGRTDPTRPTGDGRLNPGLGSGINGRQPGSTGNGQVSQTIGSADGNALPQFPDRSRDESTRPDRTDSNNDTSGLAGTHDSRMSGRDAQQLNRNSPPQPPPQAATTEGTIMAAQSQQQDDSPVTQVPYVPRSKARPAGTLLPVNMNTAVQKSLRDLEARVGSIDAYMESKVKISEMPVQPFAEQVDSVALAIDNLERGEAFILGDQTGIGKGLQLAEIAKSHINGAIRMPPNVKNLVFVTYDAKLYADFLRDLNDVGLTNVKPLLTNSDFKLTTPSGETLRTPTGKQHAELLKKLAAEGDLGSYNIVFTTYSQLQTVKGEDTVRRDFLRQIASDSLMILDESHNAGGTQNEFLSGKPTRADFVRELVSRAGGVVFSSATYAKNPYTMTLYASRTGMRHAVEDASSFVGMVSAGGVPLQQMLASTLTAQGQYLRRERSYEGIEFGAKVAPVNKAVAEDMATVMSRIMEFDKLKRPAVKQLHKHAKEEAENVGEDGSTGAAGAKSTNFTSLMHNVISQGLLALKADEAAERCIAALENGEKPVLTLANTMGSFIGRAAEEQDLEIGDAIDLSFGDILTRYLYRSRDIVIKDAWGNKTRRQLSDDELGFEALEHFEETLGLINSIDWNQIPISPIDHIRQKIEAAGYTTGEVTGREDRIRYEGGEQFYDTRPSAERSTAGAVAAVAQFNAGDIDVMILNRSGSTGISLHASERFQDQRPRRMIIAQPELDINQFMQMLGRVHRTGQVELPRFELLMGDIPAEKRPGAVLLKKMASLNANTTAARESGFSMGDITDFMNDYGDRVALELMNNNPELHARLGYPIAELNTTEEVNLDIVDSEGAINKVTGRIPLLPLEEQESVYKLLEQEYNELVENERALGNSILEAETLELDAKPLMRMEVMPKLEVGGVFGEAVNLEIMDAKSPRKPLTQLEVTNLLRRNAGFAEIGDVIDHDPDAFLAQTITQATETISTVRNDALTYSRRYVAKLEKEIKAEYATPEEEAKAQELIAAKKQKFQDKINRQFAQVSKALRDFPIGQTVRVVGKDGTIYYGVVQDVVNKGSGRGNPLTPADWKLKLQLADSARSMTIPLSKLNADKQGIQVERRDADYDGNDIYELFDIKQSQAREKRQIFTGNVIRAYEKYSGKLINFTDSQGRVRQGLLMRKGFDIETELASQPVKMPTVGNCNQFFDLTQYSGVLKTKDQVVSVVGGRDGSVTLTCPKAKDVGGKYYLDRELLNRMPGREFVSVGQEMRVWVPPENAQAVMNYFYEPGRGGLLAFTQQDRARELLGISLPKLESVTLEELQAIAEERPPIIDEPTTVNELQQTIAGLEQALNASNIADLERSLAAEVDESQIPAAEQVVNQDQPYALLTDDGYLLVLNAEGVYSDGDSVFTAQELASLAGEGGIEYTALPPEILMPLVQQFVEANGLDLDPVTDLAEILSMLNERDENGQTAIMMLIESDVNQPLAAIAQNEPAQEPQQATPVVLSMYPTEEATEATTVFVVQPDADLDTLIDRLGDTLGDADSNLKFVVGVADNLASTVGNIEAVPVISEQSFLQHVIELSSPGAEVQQPSVQQQPEPIQEPIQPDQPTYYLLVPGTEPLIGPFAEWDDADLFRRQNSNFKTTPIRDFDFVQPLLAERASLTADGYQQAVQAQQQAAAVEAAQQAVSQFLQDAGLAEALQSGVDLPAMVINAESPAPVVIEADQSGRLFITRYQDMTVTENGTVFSSQEMDLVECQLVIGSKGQLREVAIGQLGVPEYDLATGERTLIVTSRENLDAPVATEFIEQLRAEGYVKSIQAVLADRQQQQLGQQQEVEQHLLLSSYPAELVERADQIDKVGPFATTAEIDQFFVRFSDLASQSSVSYFNVGSTETWALVRDANLEAIAPQDFLQSFEREVVTEVTGIDPQQEEDRQAAIQAAAEAAINQVWSPEFIAQLQAVNGASIEELEEIRENLTNAIVSRIIGGESFEVAYAGVLEDSRARISEFREPEYVEAIAEQGVTAARAAQAAVTPDPEMPMEYYTLRAESLARSFLQMAGFAQNGNPVVEDLANRDVFELSLTHSDYPNAQPLVIAKIDDVVCFEQSLNEASGNGNKSFQFRLVQDGTEMVLVDTIVGQNQKFSPEAACIQFESWLEMGYPELVQQQYPELLQQPQVESTQAQTVNQAEPVVDVDAPLINEPLVAAQTVDQAEPVVIPQSIAVAAEQGGRPERNIARFLHETGMASVILQGMDNPNLDEGFHLRIENQPMMPLAVERQDDLLYVTHYREPQHELDDVVMDAEMVFHISETGTLKLRETAVQDPIRGGELRTTGVRANRGFADTFSRNILDQGFIEAAKIALNAKLAGLQQQEQFEAPEPEVSEVEPAIADSDGFEAAVEPEVSQPEPVVEPAEPVAVAAEATVKEGIDPREDIVQRFRDRIQEGTRTRMKGDDLVQLVTHFVNDVAQMRDQDAIKDRCAAELSLLEEGFPQRSMSSKYIPIYRRALSDAIESGAITLDDRNSHIVNWQSRDGNESGSRQEHFALTHFKYDQRTYEQLRNGVTDTRSQQSPVAEVAEAVQPIPPVVVVAPVVAVVTEEPAIAEVETVSPVEASTSETVEPEQKAPTFLESVQQLQAEHPNQIVFAKIDQFWESFYDDAATVATVLDVPLTNRPDGESLVPMAGFHQNHADLAITKLQGAGYTPFLSDLAIAQRESGQVVAAVEPMMESVSAEPIESTVNLSSKAAVEAIAPAVVEVVEQPATETVAEGEGEVVAVSEPELVEPELVAAGAQVEPVVDAVDVVEVEAELAVIPPNAAVAPVPVVAEPGKGGKSTRGQSNKTNPIGAESVAAVAPIETALPTLETPKPAGIEAVAAAEMGLNPLEVTQQMLAEHDPQTLTALQQFSQSREAKEDRYSPSLKEMADWLANAKELGRDAAYLKRITQLSNEVLAGTDEVFVAPEDRDRHARSDEFTLSKAAYKAMRRDQEEARATSVAQMARGILAVAGKDNGQQVLFERPNGNYRLAFDKQSKTLTVESKNAERGVILSEIGGVMQQHSVTDMDQQIFKAFTDAVQRRTSVPKVAAGQER